MPRLTILLCGVVVATFLLLEISCVAPVGQKEYLDKPTPKKEFDKNDEPSWKNDSLITSSPTKQIQSRSWPSKTWAKKESINDAFLANSHYSTVLKHKRCICGNACDELNKFSHGCPKSCDCKQHNRIVNFNHKVTTTDFRSPNQITSADISPADNNQTSRPKITIQELQSNEEPNEAMEFSEIVEDIGNDFLENYTPLHHAVGQNNTVQDCSLDRKKRRARKTHPRQFHSGQYVRLRGFPQHYYEVKKRARSRSTHLDKISRQGNVGYNHINDNLPDVTKANIYGPNNIDEMPTKTVDDLYRNKYSLRGLNFHKVPEFKNRLSKPNRRYSPWMTRSHPLVFKDNYQPKTLLLGNYSPSKTKKVLGSSKDFKHRLFAAPAVIEDTLPDEQPMENDLPKECSSNNELNQCDQQKMTTYPKIQQNSEEFPSTFLVEDHLPLIDNTSEEIDIDDERKVEESVPINDGDYIRSKPKRHDTKLSDLQCDDQEQDSQGEEKPPSTFLLANYVPLLSDILGPSMDESNKSETKRDETIPLDTKLTECPSTTDIQDNDLYKLIPPDTFLVDDYVPLIIPNFLQDEKCPSNLTRDDEKANHDHVKSSNVQNDVDITDLVNDISLMPTQGSRKRSRTCSKHHLPIHICQFDNDFITDNKPNGFGITENINGELYNREDAVKPQLCTLDQSYRDSGYDPDTSSKSNVHIFDNHNVRMHKNALLRNSLREHHNEKKSSNSLALYKSNLRPLDMHTKNRPTNEKSLGKNQFHEESKAPDFKPTCWAEVYLPQDFRVHVSDHNSDGGSLPDGSLNNLLKRVNVKRHAHYSTNEEESYPVFGKAKLLGRGHCFKKNTYRSMFNSFKPKTQVQEDLLIPVTRKNLRIPTTRKATEPREYARNHDHQRETLRTPRLSRIRKYTSFKIGNKPTKVKLYQVNSPKIEGDDYLSEQNVHDLNSIKTKKHVVSHVVKKNLPMSDFYEVDLDDLNITNTNIHKLNEYPLHDNIRPKTVQRKRNLIGPRLKRSYKQKAEHFPSYKMHGGNKFRKESFYNTPGHNTIEGIPIPEDVHGRNLNEASKHENGEPYLRPWSEAINRHLGNLTAPNQVEDTKKLLDRLYEINLPYLKEHESKWHELNSRRVNVRESGNHKLDRRHLTSKPIPRRSGLFYNTRSDIIQEHKGISGNTIRSLSTKNCKQIIDRLLKDNLPYLKQYRLNLQQVNHIKADHKLVERHLPTNVSSEISKQKYRKIHLHKKHSHLVQEQKGILSKSRSHAVNNCKHIIDQLLKDNMSYLTQHGLKLDPVNLKKDDHNVVERHLPTNVSSEISKHKLAKTNLNGKYSHIIQERKGISHRSHSTKDCKRILDQLLKANLPYVTELHSKKAKSTRSSPYEIIERELIEWKALNDKVPIFKTYGRPNAERHFHKDYMFSGLGKDNGFNEESLLDMCEDDAVSYNGPMGDENIPKDINPGWKEIADDYITKVDRDSKLGLKDAFSLGKNDKNPSYTGFNHTVNGSNIKACPNTLYGTTSTKYQGYMSEGNSNYEVKNTSDTKSYSQNLGIGKSEVYSQNSDFGKSEVYPENSDTGKSGMYSENSDIGKNEKQATHFIPVSVLEKEINEVLQKAKIALGEEAMPAPNSTRTAQDMQTDAMAAPQDARTAQDMQTDAMPAPNSTRTAQDMQTDAMAAPQDARTAQDVQTDAMSTPCSTSNSTVQDFQTDTEKNTLRDARVASDPSGWMWTEWSKWSPCSVSCGKGRMTRHRKCLVEECKNNTEEELHQKTCQMPACGLKGFFGLFN